MNLLAQLEGITPPVINHAAAASKTITDVQSGLRTDDPDKIKGDTRQLQAVTRSLTAMLPRRSQRCRAARMVF